MVRVWRHNHQNLKLLYSFIFNQNTDNKFLTSVRL